MVGTQSLKSEQRICTLSFWRSWFCLRLFFKPLALLLFLLFFLRFLQQIREICHLNVSQVSMKGPKDNQELFQVCFSCDRRYPSASRLFKSLQRGVRKLRSNTAFFTQKTSKNQWFSKEVIMHLRCFRDRTLFNFTVVFRATTCTYPFLAPYPPKKTKKTTNVPWETTGLRIIVH